ncbi:MAG: hypothetical protein LBP67_05130 [Bacteroidales bacterium]|jgi:hypothetical protein|nr:hypothetical protein [Bacteroidales bacterium]
MSKCVRCGDETPFSSAICDYCLDKWIEMRGYVFDALQDKYGMLSHENYQTFNKEMKRLDKIWKKDKAKFEEELNKSKN